MTVNYRGYHQSGDVYPRISTLDIDVTGPNWHPLVIDINAKSLLEVGLKPAIKATLTLASVKLIELRAFPNPYIQVHGRFQYPPFEPSALVAPSSTTPFPACNVNKHLLEYYSLFSSRGSGEVEVFLVGEFPLSFVLAQPVYLTSGCFLDWPTFPAIKLFLAFGARPSSLGAVSVGTLISEVGAEIRHSFDPLLPSTRLRIYLLTDTISRLEFVLDVYSSADAPTVNEIVARIQVSARNPNSALYGGTYLKQLSTVSTINMTHSGCIYSAPSTFDCSYYQATAPPGNDACSNAVVLTAGTASAIVPDISLATATGDPPAPSCATGTESQSTWYQFTPSTSGSYSVSTCLAGTKIPSATVAVYSSSDNLCSGGTFTQVAGGCSSSACATIEQVALSAGVTYYVVVWPTSAFSVPLTSVQVIVNQVFPPPNDLCANAVLITPSVPTAIVSLISAFSTSDVVHSCALAGAGTSRTVWYRFVPTSTAPYSISTCLDETTFMPSIISVLTSSNGLCTGALTEAACALGTVDGSECGARARLAPITLNAATTYFIAVSFVESASSAPFGTDLSVLVEPFTSPSADQCEGATNVTDSGVYPLLSSIVSMFGTTTADDPITSCNAVPYRAPGYWFSFSPLTSQYFSISSNIVGTTVDSTLIEVFSSSTLDCTGVRTSVACVDDGFTRAVLGSAFMESGKRYFIFVSTRSKLLPGKRNLQLEINLGPPPNVQCANSLPIVPTAPLFGYPYLSPLIAQTHLAPIATTTACTSATASYLVYFHFVPDHSNTFTFTTCSPATGSTLPDTVLAISDSGCGTLIACDDDDASCVVNTRSTVSVDLVGGTTYRVIAGTYGLTAPAAASSAVQVQVSTVPPPSDICSNAVVLPLASFPALSAIVQASAATTTGDPPFPHSPTRSRSVWFRFTVATQRRLSLNTCSMSVGTVFGVYNSTNGCAGPFVLLASPTTCSLGQEFLPGEYFVVVFVANNPQLVLPGAPIQLTIDAPPPQNDNCEGSVLVPSSSYPAMAVVSDIRGATSSFDPITSCAPSSASFGVWFQHTPLTSGDYSVSTCGLSTTLPDPVLAVFSPPVGGAVCDLQNYQELRCNDDSSECGLQSFLPSVSLEAGKTYYIVVYNFGSVIDQSSAVSVQVVIDRSTTTTTTIITPAPTPAPMTLVTTGGPFSAQFFNSATCDLSRLNATVAGKTYGDCVVVPLADGVSAKILAKTSATELLLTRYNDAICSVADIVPAILSLDTCVTVGPDMSLKIIETPPTTTAPAAPSSVFIDLNWKSVRLMLRFLTSLAEGNRGAQAISTLLRIAASSVVHEPSSKRGVEESFVIRTHNGVLGGELAQQLMQLLSANPNALNAIDSAVPPVDRAVSASEVSDSTSGNSSGSSSVPIGVIIGVVVGVLVLVAIAVAVFVVMRRKQSSASEKVQGAGAVEMTSKPNPHFGQSPRGGPATDDYDQKAVVL